MTFLAKISLRTLAATFALGAMPLSFAQISDAELDSIFDRLNGDDFAARYAARMDLQDEVSAATAPGKEAQQAIVEQQLLERLQSEPLLTTKLWILRQIESIGSEAAIPQLRQLVDSGDGELAKGARMAMDRIVPPPQPEPPPYEGLSASELADLARNAPNRSIRYRAFMQLSKQDAKAAAAVMLDAEASAAEFIRIAMNSSSSLLRREALAQLDSPKVSHQIAVLGALSEKLPQSVEKSLLRLLESENETLELQTIEALGRAGTARSLQALLSRIEARSRDLRDAAADALAAIPDSKIDRSLRKMLKRGAVEERVLALKALSLRASPGVNRLVNAYAADSDLDNPLREEAISNMELVGDVDSFPILVDIVLNEAQSGLRRDAQKTLKRMSLRLADPDAAWAAFEQGFAASEGDVDTQLALLLVSDAAPNAEAIAFLKSLWNAEDPRFRKTLLRVLPAWRNWDGGFALLELAAASDESQGLQDQCFAGIGKLILGSDATYPMDVKFELAAAALDQAKNPRQRQSVITGFRYSTWRERVHVTYNEVDPELKEAVLEYAKD
ncbi:HEAT repeat domain-containing protein [Pelagicoccus sp. NFK12]|uniref:HEAT repeat domain-containing protein n=1 Tax=Pelagicoccus enzymogenes TaxID=2773457 RepID=A0A927IHF3_9BACT|nr:HEAT repeat domain-containing protein [Pelagicoccus enzymogenes]MBD5780121.1 HEAT repeat domain-containing protein [Pelagicoccus enzymogenes]